MAGVSRRSDRSDFRQKNLLIIIFPGIKSFAYIVLSFFSEFTTDLMSDAASLFATGGGVLSGDCPQDMKALAGVITREILFFALSVSLVTSDGVTFF